MSNAIRICLIALGLVLGNQALAAEPSAKPGNEGNLEVARAAFQRGVELFHEGNFEAAMAEFQKANLNAPSYRILYNIAQTCFELHDYVAALKYYKQYLASGETEIPAARKTQVEETIQKLQTRIAYLEISVNVEGAQVSIDDVPVGVSPLAGPVPVNPGPRRVVANKAGLPSSTRTLTVAGADHVEVDLELQASSRGGAQAESASLATSGPLSHKAGSRSRVPLITGLAVTGACALTTGIFGWLALRAKDDFNRDLDRYGVSPSKVSDDRNRLRNFALVTDIAAGATLVAGGVTLYMLLAHGGSDKAEASRPQPRLALTPTLNGAAVYGSW